MNPWLTKSSRRAREKEISGQPPRPLLPTRKRRQVERRNRGACVAEETRAADEAVARRRRARQGDHHTR